MPGHRLRRKAWAVVLVCAALSSLEMSMSIAAAAEKETRIFTIKVDGRPAGDYQMTISRPDDHTFMIDARANVFVSYFLVKYRYSYHGTEVWKDGRLVYLSSKTNDDSKQFEVLAQPDGENLRVRVNRTEHLIRPDVWTTTYWSLPPVQFGTQAVALLDCDTGKELRGTMQYMGMQQLTLPGEVQNCPHYRLTGGVQVELWYDAQQRLVREVAVDDGHQVLLELARIDR
jgi:Family of unknown function (DUF6134)